MALYVLQVHNGIYHWIRIMIATLPRDKDDSGKVERCVGLMLTLKVRMYLVHRHWRTLPLLMFNTYHVVLSCL
jgi:hypothetical protein